MIKNNKLEINLSTTETLNLKRFLGSRGIIDKDLSISLSKYIKKYMQEEEKEVVKETKKTKESSDIIKLCDWDSKKEIYLFNKKNIILIQFFQNDSPDTIDFTIVYLDENNIVQKKYFSSGWETKRSQERYDKLGEAMKSIETIEIDIWNSKNTYESQTISVVKKYIQSVSVDKKKRKIHIYGPNGYLYSTPAYTSKEQKLFNESIKKLKDYIKE